MKKTAPDKDKRQEEYLKEEEFWTEIENHPRFIQMIAEAWKDLREGRGVRLEDVED